MANNAIHKIKIYILVVLLFLSQSAVAVTDTPWAPYGPNGATVFSSLRHPTVAGEIFIGTYFGGLYVSNDYGVSWTHVNGPFSEDAIFYIAIDAGDPNTIYVSTFGKGIYKSIDHGASWSAINNGITDLNINVVSIDPFDTNNLLAATTVKIYRSTDGGSSWSVAGSGIQFGAHDFTFHPAQSGTVYAATPTEKVFRSTDSGATWQLYDSGLGTGEVTRFTSYNTSGYELYAAMSDGFYRLDTATDTWENITYDLPDGVYHEVVRQPVSGELFAATDVGIFRSLTAGAFSSWSKWSDAPTTRLLIDEYASIIHAAITSGTIFATVDDGATWFPAADGLQNMFVGALASIAVGNTSVLYAGADSGVMFTSEFFSTGNGQQVWVEDDNLSDSIFSLETHPLVTGTLFAGTEKSGVWKSTDWGSIWNQLSNGMVPNRIFSIGQSPTTPTTLYAGTSSGLYVSQDNGSNWIKGTVAGIPRLVFSVAPDPVLNKVAFFGSTGGQIYTTIDGGSTIYLLSESLPSENVMALKVAPWGNHYAVTSGGGVYVSGNAGVEWFPSNTGVSEPALAIDLNPASPWIMYLGTAGGGVYKSVSGAIAWQQATSGMGNQYIFAITVDAATPDTVYAGGVGVVYKTTDAAASWQVVSAGLPSANILDLKIDNINSQVIYASVESNGVYKSTDGGSTWSPVGSGVPSSGNTAIALNPANTQVLYVGTEKKGVYKSSDAGTSWGASSNGMSLFVRGLAVDQSTPGNMYAGSLANGVFRTQDGGTNWEYVAGTEGGDIFDVDVSLTAPSNIMVSTSWGLMRSTDTGTSWHLPGQQTAFVHSLIADPVNPDILYLGAVAGTGVLKSSDAGLTWVSRSTGLPAANAISLALDTANNDLYLGLENSTLYKSTNDGNSWTEVLKADTNGHHFTGITVNTVNGDVYAVTDGSGVYRSVDSGASWSRLNTGLNSLVATSIAVDGGNVYASVFDGVSSNPGVYRLNTTSLAWGPVSNGLTSSFVNKVIVDAGTASVLYAITESGIFKSTDDASSWQAASTGLGPGVAVISMLIDSNDSSILFAGTSTGEIYKSADAAQSWTALAVSVGTSPIRELLAGKLANTVVAGTMGYGTVTTTDSGVTWSAGIDSSLVRPFSLVVRYDPTDANVLYVGSGGLGVLKSTDGGITWQKKNNGLSNLYVLSMVINPYLPSTIYAGTSLGGVFISEDGGDSWSPLNTGLYNKNITSLELDKSNPGIVYAGTEGGGVFKNVRP